MHLAFVRNSFAHSARCNLALVPVRPPNFSTSRVVGESSLHSLGLSHNSRSEQSATAKEVVVGSDVRSAYLHLPFCKKRCFYCDFPISVVGSGSAPSQAVQDYAALLAKEIAATQPRTQAPLDTIYFGGGTPSLFPPQELGRILQLLADSYGISATAEVSMESGISAGFPWTRWPLSERLVVIRAFYSVSCSRTTSC